MLVPIPALNDNYIWLYGRENSPIIVIDIPEIAPLRQFLTAHSVPIAALLLTHHHNDHTQGVTEFKQDFPQVPIYGPQETQSKGATHIIQTDNIEIAGYSINVIPTGGHTEQHLSYVIDEHLFCGDSLFSAGCGRVFTGNYAQMFEGLNRLKQLPEQTLVCAGHEYTLSNLAFARTVLLEESAVIIRQQQAQQLRSQNKPTMPTTLALEKQINPFLRAETLERFIQLRQAKDIF